MPSATPLTLCPMTTAHLPQVMAIAEAAFLNPWPETVFRQQLQQAKEQDTARFEVACYKNFILGYSVGWLLVDEFHLGNIASHPTLRRQGIGERLLLSLLTTLPATPAEVMTLEVRPSNVAAVRLYQKYGFAEVGRRLGYYSDNGEDALIMTTPPLNDPAYQAEYGPLIAQRSVALQRLNLPPQGVIDCLSNPIATPTVSSA